MCLTWCKNVLCMNMLLFGWHFLRHRPQNNTSLNIPHWLPEKSVLLQLVMILTAYFPQLLPVIFLLLSPSLQWFSRVAWRHFNICSWCALMLLGCHFITTYFVTLFLLTVWCRLSVTCRYLKRTFLIHSTVNDAWSVPSDSLTPHTSSTSAKFIMTSTYFWRSESWWTWQTLFKVLPSAWVLKLPVELRVVIQKHCVFLPENYMCCLWNFI